MNANRFPPTRMRRLAVLCAVLSLPAHALSLSDQPLFLGGNISPNVMFTLDDSGSMQWEVMPEDYLYVYYMFPTGSNIYGGNDYTNYVPEFSTSNIYNVMLRSSDVNKIYYNPEVTYQPWSNQDGSLMANASPGCAYYNPANTAKGCLTLNSNQTMSARWLQSNGTFTSSTNKTFYPAVYFKYNSGSIWSTGNYTQVEIKSSTPTYTGGPNRTDCAAKPTCTYAEEIQNFANWFTYYRSRLLLARAGTGKAFSAQGNTMRVGFGAINKGSTTIDGVSTGAVVRGVRQFTGTDRTGFFTNLYGYSVSDSGTPLRTALNRVGQYFQRTDDAGPWGETPGLSGGTQHACRQSYNILMTDGYWNDNYSGVNNADNTAGLTITNHSSPPTPATYAYSPGSPYSDSYGNTLADVAMYYWKTDLRSTLDNKVPTNSTDPAFWQHLVNFTVGLGVSGTIPYTANPTAAWPDPTAGNQEKIDDLWHAAVNSRGGFYSAANPTDFANALSATLTNIVARTGSASAVATSSSSLTTNGRLYQAKFNSGDWSGQLLSIPIDSSGTIGATEWDAGTVINSIAPASRVILTKGSTGDGVAFQYANLTSAEQTYLNTNASGTTDMCGSSRVDYLRGDATNEGASGTFNCATGGTSINKFRPRVNSKLGDIVNSSPFYVGAPSAGYSDVDHPGYSSFSGTSGYSARMPMVYVGANDGTLHGFNACVPGVTAGCATSDEGKELIAYVPSPVYGNLSRLTDTSYNANHRYFVDGSPFVADVNIGTSGTPNWRSVLIGGMNAGGKGYYALDVTNPKDGSKTAPVFSDTNAADLLLWEFTNADDADMGYSYNLPPVDPFTSQAMQIVQMENGEWAVILGNGYNSTNGHAMLYVLFIKGGLDGTWTVGTDYIKLIADNGTGNGLSTPVPFDSDGNGKIDVIYAGDLKGNMWKFNVSSSTPGSWPASATLLFAAGINKPITSPPVVTLHPSGGQLVLFGTGKYLETGDTTSTYPQTMYGIWDTGSTVTSGQLIAQTATVGASYTTISQNAVAYSTTGTVVKGWSLNLPTSGERLAGIPSVEDGLFTFTTITPSTSPCDFGGSGLVYTVNYYTGGMLTYPAFDTNGNGYVTSADSLAAGVSIGFAPGGVTRVRGTTNDVLVSSRADGTLVKTPAAKAPATVRGRINWRELVQ